MSVVIIYTLISLAGLIAYLTCGGLIGRMAAKEYLNGKATEALSIGEKAKRILLFPQSYFSWNKRFFNNRDGPTLLPCDEDSKRSHLFHEHYYLDDMAKLERYVKIMTFLWPIKLIAFTGALAVIIGLGSYRTCLGIVSGINFLMRRLFKSKIFELDFTPEQLGCNGEQRLRSLVKRCSVSIDKLSQSRNELADQKERTGKLLESWKQLTADLQAEKLVTIDLSQSVTAISRLEECEEKISLQVDKLGETIDSLTKQKASLELFTRMARLYRETSNLLPEFVDEFDLIKEQIESELNAASALTEASDVISLELEPQMTAAIETYPPNQLSLRAAN